MIRKLLRGLCLFPAVLLVILTASSGYTVSAEAAGKEASARTSAEIISALCESRKVKSTQKLIDGYASDPSAGGEWIVMSLRNSVSGPDYSKYREALEKYVAETTFTNPVTGLKEALTLMAVGSDSDFVRRAVDSFTDEAKINTLIYSLFLMENGAKSEKYTKADLREAVLKLRHPDGGWSVTGDSADVDITAMVIQCLTPGMEEDPALKDVIDSALVLLSEKQLDNGGFVSMGNENPESAAQVIVALTGLGLDPRIDARFIKNGCDLFDALERFRTKSGLYCHISGSSDNAMTISQALYAYVSLERMERGEGMFFLFGALPEANKPSLIQKLGLRFVISFGIGLTAALLSFWLLLIRKKKVTALVIPLALASLSVILLNTVKIQSVSSYYGEQPVSAGPKIATTISVRCDEVAGRETWIPADGVILGETEIEIPEGGTAYDQLSAAARSRGLQLGVDGGSYIVSVNNLAELQFGSLSGWVFTVNGVLSDRSLRDTELKEGDRVEWIYSLNMGKKAEGGE